MAARQADGTERRPKSPWEAVRAGVAADRPILPDNLTAAQYAEIAVSDVWLQISRLGYVLHPQIGTCGDCGQKRAEVLTLERERLQGPAEELALLMGAQAAINAPGYRERTGMPADESVVARAERLANLAEGVLAI